MRESGVQLSFTNENTMPVSHCPSNLLFCSIFNTLLVNSCQAQAGSYFFIRKPNSRLAALDLGNSKKKSRKKTVEKQTSEETSAGNILVNAMENTDPD
jgi:hypothetical protein